MTTGEPVFCSLWRSGAVFSQSEAEGDRKYTSVRLKKEGKKSGKEKAEKEEEEKKVSVRSRFAGDEGQKGLEEFIAAIMEETAKKEIREVTKEEK